MSLGNLSNVKPVGEGVLEFRIDFGPGYRIYFGRDGSEVIFLLGGGSKKGQHQDIGTA
jgi:putative addiction module killer protein